MTEAMNGPTEGGKYIDNIGEFQKLHSRSTPLV